MDFLQQLKSKLESVSYTPPIIMIGSYNSGANSVAIRPAPSNISVTYANKDKLYPFSFQVLVHHANNLSAYTLAQQIMWELEKADRTFVTSNNNSFTLNKIETTTTVNHVEKTSYGDLWTAIFSAELIIKGDE